MFEDKHRNSEELKLEDGEWNDVPEIFLCPIGRIKMKDPVIVAETGQTYERNEIEKWFKENATDYLTKKKLKNLNLVENITLRNAIKKFKKSESRLLIPPRKTHISCTSPNHHGRDELRHTFKVSVIGPTGVGKTSLIRKLCYGEYNENWQATLQLDTEFVVVKVGDNLVRLCFWDTAGQERFNSCMFSFIRGSDAVLTVFDLSKEETLNEAGKYLQKAQTDDALLFLVGTKADMLNSREMKAVIENGQRFADNNSMIFFTTSAKNALNIKKLLLKIARSLSAMSNKKVTSVIRLNQNTNSDQNVSSKKCCKG